MKRILIHEDNDLAKKIQSDLKTFKPLLDDLKRAYESLEMGSFKSEILEQLKEQGLKPLEVEYSELIASQLDKSGITLKQIRENMTRGSQKIFQNFARAFEAVKSFEPKQYGLNQRPILDYGQISYSDEFGKFHISPEEVEVIKEFHCRIYLENEKEKELYDALNNLRDIQTNIRSILEKAGYSFGRKGYEQNEINDVFFTGYPERFVKPTSIAFALKQKDNREKVKKLKQRMSAIN